MPPLRLHHAGLALLVVLAHLLFGNQVAPPRVAAQSVPPIVYLQYNTDLDLEPNGLLHVRIMQQIGFGDEFSSAFFDIPRAFTTGIQNVRVLEATTQEGHLNPETADFTPIRASIAEGMDYVSVEWEYERTAPGDIRSFVIEYDVVGALWLYPGGDLIRWHAVHADRSGIPVQSSVVRITLPPAIPLDRIRVSASGPSYRVEDQGGALVLTADEPIPDGQAFEVEARFPHGLLNAEVQEWQRAWDAETLAVEVDTFHADLTIRPDGTIHVAETTTLRVRQSTLHQGFRTISLLYLDDATNFQVSQDSQPLDENPGGCTGCYAVHRVPRPDSWIYYDPDLGETVIQEGNSGRVSVDWYGEPRQAPASTTVDMSYDLIGALRVAPDSQLLVWPVTPDYGLPIAHASVRIHLPPGVNPAEVTVEGPPGQGAPQVVDASAIELHFDGPVDPGAWSLALTLPGGATSATAPAWQSQFEQVIAEADAAAAARARSLLLLRFTGILLLVGAGLAAVVYWVRRGRTSVREKLYGFESEPPSRLSPAIVSFLVDRKASEKGLLGAIFHLATVGALGIDMTSGITLRRRRAEPIGSARTLPDAYGDPVPIDRHLAYLFDSVLRPAVPQDRTVRLDAIAPALRAHLPELYAQLGRDVQRYFIDIPGRSTSVPPVIWVILFATLAALVLLGLLPILAAIVIGVIAVALLALLGRASGGGTYSDEGVREAERWRRFKNYLADLQRYGDQAAAQEILDRYFGYAVALGVEEVVLAQAEALGAGGPIWMPTPVSSSPTPSTTSTPQSWPPRPVQRPRPTVGTLLGAPRPKPATPRPRPTLAGMSETLGGSLRRASSDLGALLATAAGSSDSSARTVVLDSPLGRREMQWQPGASVNTVLDDILKQSVADARAIRARQEAERAARAAQRAQAEAERHARAERSRDRDDRSRSSSRSSGGFGRSSSGGSHSSSFSRSSSSSRSSSRSSSSSGSRSGGGGRSGFR